MSLAKRLRTVTIQAQQEDDLPDYLASRILAISNQLEEKESLCNNIETLIEQVSLYDTYAQTGYLGMGVNHLILEKTIQRIEEQLTDCS